MLLSYCIETLQDWKEMHENNIDAKISFQTLNMNYDYAEFIKYLSVL